MLLKRENESLKADQGNNLQSAVQGLEDEITFLKRHYDIEMNLLKD